MYGRLRGAKVFSTLDLRSGYYHIGLLESSKAKTGFVTLFGKYQFEAVPFGLADLKMVTRKYTEARNKPHTLQAAFTLAEDCSARMMEAKSFECNNAFRLLPAVNELSNSNAEIDEVSHGRWNNNKCGNYGNKQWSKDNKSWNKQDKGRSFEGNDKKTLAERPETVEQQGF